MHEIIHIYNKSEFYNDLRRIWLQAELAEMRLNVFLPTEYDLSWMFH